jgi:hypothetical protein
MKVKALAHVLLSTLVVVACLGQPCCPSSGGAAVPTGTCSCPGTLCAGLCGQACANCQISGQSSGTVSGSVRTSNCRQCSPGGANGGGSWTPAGKACLGANTMLSGRSIVDTLNDRRIFLMKHMTSLEPVHGHALCMRSAGDVLCATRDHFVSIDGGESYIPMRDACSARNCSVEVMPLVNYWHADRNYYICGRSFCVSQRIDNPIHRALDAVEALAGRGVVANALWRVAVLFHL